MKSGINNVHFIRSIKEVKNKNLQELFKNEEQKEIIKMYSQLRTTKKKDDDNENKIPDFTITLDQLKKTIGNNLNFDLSNDTLEIIFYALKIPFVEDTKVDFLLFFKIYYLIYTKIYAGEEEGEAEAEAEAEGEGEEGSKNQVEEQGYGGENEQEYESALESHGIEGKEDIGIQGENIDKEKEEA